MLEISTDKSKLDIDFIVEFLQQSYWANTRSRVEIIKSIAHSWCFGAYLNGEQIGFARVLTDQVAFSYIMDVFIDEKYQGKHYGSKFFEEIYQHSSLINVKAHYLLTKDAQNFYHSLGFKTFPTPEKFMFRLKE